MNGSVPVKVRALGEELPSVFSFVRLLVCMYSEMGKHVPGLRKSPASIIVFADVYPFVRVLTPIWVVPNLILMSLKRVIVDHISIFV